MKNNKNNLLLYIIEIYQLKKSINIKKIKQINKKCPYLKNTIIHYINM